MPSSRDIKPRTISRAITPRNIKDIRPKRHLLRPSEKKKRQQQQQSNDDDLSWYSSVRGDDSSTVGNRRQFRFGSYDYNEDSDDISHSRNCSLCSILKRLFSCLIRICVMIKNGYHRIREMPPQKRRKRFLMLMILICALRSMFMNLDQYKMFDINNEKYDSNKPIPMQRRQSRDDRFTTLKEVDKEMNDMTASMFGTPSKTQTKTMGEASDSGTSSLRGLSSINHNVEVQQQSKPIDASPVKLAGSYSSSNSISTGNKMIPSNTMKTKVSPQLSSSNGLGDVQQQNPLSNSQTYKSSAVQSGNQYSSGGLVSSSQQQSMSARSKFHIGDSSQQQTGSGLSRSSTLNTQSGNKQPLVGSIITNNNSQNRKSSEGLQCKNHGGPIIESDYSEIIYWKDIPTDLSFTSPYYNPQAQEASSSSFWKTKYLTFEMDVSWVFTCQCNCNQLLLLISFITP